MYENSGVEFAVFVLILPLVMSMSVNKHLTQCDIWLTW